MQDSSLVLEVSARERLAPTNCGWCASDFPRRKTWSLSRKWPCRGVGREPSVRPTSSVRNRPRGASDRRKTVAMRNGHIPLRNGELGLSAGAKASRLRPLPISQGVFGWPQPRAWNPSRCMNSGLALTRARNGGFAFSRSLADRRVRTNRTPPSHAIQTAARQRADRRR